MVASGIFRGSFEVPLGALGFRGSLKGSMGGFLLRDHRGSFKGSIGLFPEGIYRGLGALGSSFKGSLTGSSEGALPEFRVPLQVQGLGFEV